MATIDDYLLPEFLPMNLCLNSYMGDNDFGENQDFDMNGANTNVDLPVEIDKLIASHSCSHPNCVPLRPFGAHTWCQESSPDACYLRVDQKLLNNTYLVYCRKVRVECDVKPAPECGVCGVRNLTLGLGARKENIACDVCFEAKRNTVANKTVVPFDSLQTKEVSGPNLVEEEEEEIPIPTNPSCKLYLQKVQYYLKMGYEELQF
ncbi:hypothetical protein K501DRAFT_271807 [Backusella circina FSU 941]|nr:hypothetical protein K501DRAFT_271807 [Backusella circina FSU 941]